MKQFSNKLVFAFILFISLGVFSDQNTMKKNLIDICSANKKKNNKLTGDSKKYCTCWVANVSSVAMDYQETILMYYRGQIEYSVFENKFNPLANFEIDVVEACIADPTWRKRKVSSLNKKTPKKTQRK